MNPDGRSTNVATIEPLTRQQIERRIHDLALELSAPAGNVRDIGGDGESYRWIEPADLVRRMRPYLGLN